jgi:hypothetical protein
MLYIVILILYTTHPNALRNTKFADRLHVYETHPIQRYSALDLEA